jgi:predicted dehydrogenase
VGAEEVNRILIVGHGSIGQRHLRIARGLLPDAFICVLRHQRCESVPEYANDCVSSLEEALAFAPQLAVIANPATLHLQIARPLAKAGVHLLVEKPLSAVLEGLEEFLATCKERSLVLMTAYNLRFSPSLQEYRRLIQSGIVGKIISVRCEIGQYLPSWRPESDYRNSVSATHKLGGGVMLELSHEIDYLRWIFGEVEWINATLAKLSNLEIDVEDTAHLVLGFQVDLDGRRLIANLNMDFVRQDTTRQCIAIGEQGSLRWNGVTGTVELFPAGGSAWQLLFSHLPVRDETYMHEWQHFLECIRQRSSPLINGEDGYAALRIIEAARQSATRTFTSVSISGTA